MRSRRTARRARILAAASLFDKSKQQPASAATTSLSFHNVRTSPRLGLPLLGLVRACQGCKRQPIMPTMRKRAKESQGRRVNAATRLQQARDSDSSFDSSNPSRVRISPGRFRTRPPPMFDADRMGPAPRASLWRKTRKAGGSSRLVAQAAQATQITSPVNDVKGQGQGTTPLVKAGIRTTPTMTTQTPVSGTPSSKTTSTISMRRPDDDDDDDLGSEEPDTDDDEEAVFLEAMRLRGLLSSNLLAKDAKASSSRINSRSASRSKDPIHPTAWTKTRMNRWP